MVISVVGLFVVLLIGALYAGAIGYLLGATRVMDRYRPEIFELRQEVARMKLLRKLGADHVE